ncbi:MAG TPA: hypothetical protein VGP94_07820 [Tepidisphaeraceae bacterium]|nr:hypothetical protein [Tepidisphaeraceae bacterium]
MSQFIPPPMPPQPPPLPPDVAKPRKSMLQWPAIFPLVAFIAIQAIYGWPEAKVRASSPEYAISYLMGGIMGGLFVSLIVAWISYRVSGRSRSAATIAFSVVLILGCGSVIQKYQALKKTGGSGSAAPAAGERVNFPIFGISLTPPAGWQPMPPDRKGVIAAWASPESRPNDQRAIIILEWEKATSNDVGDRARDVATGWGGRFTGELREMDRKMAWELKADAPQSGLKPVEGLAVLHDGHFFFLTGGVSPGESVSQEIELIRKSWKWIPVEAPTAHLEFRAKPLRFLGGKIAINYPAIATADQTGEKSIILHIADFQRSDTQMEAAIDLIELANADKFEVVRDRMSKSAMERLKLPQAPAWHALGGPTQREITQALPSADGSYRMIFSLVNLEPRRFVVISFSIFTDQAQEQAAYAAMAEKIVVSIAAAP